MNEQLLKKHLKDAPRMEVQDAVKLAFQSAFGCGHLLSAREACADFVRREMAQVAECADVPAFTPIGCCLSRLNLASPVVRPLSPERIADLMMLSDQRVRMRGNNHQRFEAILSQLDQLAQNGETSFSPADLQTYLAAYRAQGCPPVSHSEAYRQAYHPAYRVLLSDLAVLVPVIAKIDRGECSVVVIDGPCGSGKTTLASLLAALYHTTPIPMDDFFLPPEMRTSERLSMPGGNVHHERFSAEILDKLEVGSPFSYDRFDCQTGTLVHREHAASDVVIIEGSYSHHPVFAQAYERLGALRVFISVSGEDQLCRIAQRDPGMLDMFRSRWIPLEKTYFEAYDIKDRADLRLESQPWDRA